MVKTRKYKYNRRKSMKRRGGRGGLVGSIINLFDPPHIEYMDNQLNQNFNPPLNQNFNPPLNQNRNQTHKTHKTKPKESWFRIPWFRTRPPVEKYSNFNWPRLKNYTNVKSSAPKISERTINEFKLILKNMCIIILNDNNLFNSHEQEKLKSHLIDIIRFENKNNTNIRNMPTFTEEEYNIYLCLSQYDIISKSLQNMTIEEFIDYRIKILDRLQKIYHDINLNHVKLPTNSKSFQNMTIENFIKYKIKLLDMISLTTRFDNLYELYTFYVNINIKIEPPKIKPSAMVKDPHNNL